MFDLERSIADWRAWMKADGIKAPRVLDELESHLRDDVQARMTLGSEGREAFEAAVQQIGLAAALRSEFMKAGVRGWNRPLAVTAWTLFLVSFFLPSFNGALGWGCALLQPALWQDAMNGNWGSIHYELLTLANLLMLASPILFFRCDASPRVSMWFRRSTLVTVLLVWSYVGLWLTTTDRWSLEIGCYTWATSFALLLASMVVRRERTRQHV
jgi:hypothetical protein